MRVSPAACVLFLLALFGAPGAVAGPRTIDFAAGAEPTDALIAAVKDSEDLVAVEAVIGADAAAALRRAVAAAGFKPAAGDVKSFLTGAESFGEIHLVGVGAEPLRERDIEDFGGRAAGLAKASKAARVAVLPPSAVAADLADAAFGAALGQYSFDRYKTGDSDEAAAGALVFLAADPAAARAEWNSERRHVADAVMFARDLQSEPANVLDPEDFLPRARAAFRGVPGVAIEVLDVSAMERLGMGALLGVGKGSVRPPRLLVVRYTGGAAGEAPIALAGKGITFDSGGISIKPNAGMWQMKSDMTGAAAVTATVLGLAKSKAPVNVVSFAALAENMPDGGATRPGDVLTSMSGKTIEILSTDAEGRLVLSDAVWYAQERYKPKVVIDVATLTGSVVGALSDEYAGLFTRDDALAAKLIAAGEASGDDVWRLPLHPNYKKQIKSDIADVKNADTGSPGAGTGAEFIGAFIKEGQSWAHLDIAGMDWRTDALPTVPKGASGYSVRLLDRYVREEAAAD